ncbi:MAG: hypothetical protein H0T17_07035 [Propionibacteriales bacterium]|nr:hypothetical protein [Propionibacteriales bacterium]
MALAPCLSATPVEALEYLHPAVWADPGSLSGCCLDKVLVDEVHGRGRHPADDRPVGRPRNSGIDGNSRHNDSHARCQDDGEANDGSSLENGDASSRVRDHAHVMARMLHLSTLSHIGLPPRMLSTGRLS